MSVCLPKFLLICRARYLYCKIYWVYSKYDLNRTINMQVNKNVNPILSNCHITQKIRFLQMIQYLSQNIMKKFIPVISFIFGCICIYLLDYQELVSKQIVVVKHLSNQEQTKMSELEERKKRITQVCHKYGDVLNRRKFTPSHYSIDANHKIAFCRNAKV